MYQNAPLELQNMSTGIVAFRGSPFPEFRNQQALSFDDYTCYSRAIREVS
jgi:hypothetical protein